MRRSSIITRFAVEQGYLDSNISKKVEREYQSAPESETLTFESWAVTKNYITIENAKALLETVASSRFLCTSCGKDFLGKQLIGGTEYICPNCSGQDFLLQSKSKLAFTRKQKAPKLTMPVDLGIDSDTERPEPQNDIPESAPLENFLNIPREAFGNFPQESEDSQEPENKDDPKKSIDSNFDDFINFNDFINPDVDKEKEHLVSTMVDSDLPIGEVKKSDTNKDSQQLPGNQKKIELTPEMLDKGLPPNSVLDGVAIEKIVGRGGIGIVYRGTDLNLERPVALKVLNSEVLSDVSQVERFGIEAKTMAQLEHPNVVQVYKFGKKFNRPYLVMQWVDGENLGQKIDSQGALPLLETLNWFIQVARGLLEAHNHGIIHRDVKPDNIIINSKGNVKIVDFGLAKQVVRPEMINLSDPRFVLGTPAYIAPEQALGEQIDNRTDIYSYTISMYHALTGQLPFTGSPAAVVHQHISTPLPSVKAINPTIPDDLNLLIKKMSSKNKENRPNDMEEVVSELESILIDNDPNLKHKFQLAPGSDAKPSEFKNPKGLTDSQEVLSLFDSTFDAISEFEIKELIDKPQDLAEVDESKDSEVEELELSVKQDKKPLIALDDSVKDKDIKLEALKEVEFTQDIVVDSVKDEGKLDSPRDVNEISEFLPDGVIQATFTSRKRHHLLEEKTDLKARKAETPKIFELPKDYKKKSKKTIPNFVPIVLITVIVVFMALGVFLLIEKLNPDVSSNGFPKTERYKVIAEMERLVGKAKVVLETENGPDAIILKIQFDRFVKNNAGFNFSIEFKGLSGKINNFIAKYKKNQAKQLIQEKIDEFTTRMSSADALIYKKELMDLAQENPEIAEELGVKTIISTKVDPHIMQKEISEEEESKLDELIKEYQSVDTESAKSLLLIVEKFSELCKSIPRFETDVRVKDIRKQIENNLENSIELKKFNEINSFVMQIHQTDTDSDSVDILFKLNTLVAQYPHIKSLKKVAKLLKKLELIVESENKEADELLKNCQIWQDLKDKPNKTDEEKKKLNDTSCELYQKLTMFVSQVPRKREDLKIITRISELKSYLNIVEFDIIEAEKIVTKGFKAVELEDINRSLQEIEDFLSQKAYMKQIFEKVSKVLKDRKAKIIRTKNEDLTANEIQTLVDELIARAEKETNIRADADVLLDRIQKFLAEVDKHIGENENNRFTKKFEILTDNLNKLLQNERLVVPPSCMKFDWQAKIFAKSSANNNLEFEQFSGSYSPGHVNKINIIKTDKTKSYLLTCDIAGIVKITMLKNMKEIRSLDMGGGITSADFMDDTEKVIFALENGKIEIWNIALRQKVMTFENIEVPVYSMVIGDENIYCTTNSPTIYEFSSSSGKVVNKHLVSRSKFTEIAISDDKKRICASSKSKIYLWEINNSKLTNEIIINASGTNINSLDFNDKGTKIISSAEDGASKLWTIEGSFLNDVKINGFQIYNTIMISSKLGVAINDKAELIIFDVNDLRNSYSVLAKLGDESRSIDFWTTDSTSFLAVGDDSGNITILKTTDFNDWEIIQRSDYVIASNILPSGKILQVFTSGLCRLTDFAGTILTEKALINRRPTFASISRLSSKIVIGTIRGHFYIVDAEKLEIQHTIREITEKITAIDISKDGSKIIVGYENGEMQLYNGESAERYNVKFPKFNKAVEIVSINQKGDFSVVGEKTGFMSIISLPQGEIIKNIFNVSQNVEYVQFANDDADVLISSVKNSKGELIKFNIETGKHESFVQNLDTPIKHFKFFSTNKMLLSMQNGNTNFYKNFVNYDTHKIKSLSDFVIFSTVIAGKDVKKFMENWNVEESALVITTKRGISAIYTIK